MASQVPFNQAIHDLGVHDEDHPVWTSAFNDEDRLRQLREDLTAGRRVSGLLVTIVSSGLLLAVVTVFFLT